MKKLYEHYQDDGFAVIGISLDQPKEEGGLDRLRNFVAENDIEWPQWYLGNGWESAFSQSWGIDSIPTLFLIDAEGRLRSTSIRPDEIKDEVAAFVVKHDDS